MFVYFKKIIRDESQRLLWENICIISKLEIKKCGIGIGLYLKRESQVIPLILFCTNFEKKVYIILKIYLLI